MKKALCLLLCLLLLLPFGVSAFAEEAKTGTLKMLAYNVSGIPLIGDFQGSVVTTTADRAAKLGALLNEADADFISVEEDFNGHNRLAEQMTAYSYRSFTSGGLLLGQGLNVFSRRPLYNLQRVNWKTEFGTLSGSADALANKGFLYALMELEDGVFLHVITLHCDAGYDPLSVRARRDNFRQLSAWIDENLNDGRALIVQGDFNFKFKRQLKDDLAANLLEKSGLQDVWALLTGGVLDPNDPAFPWEEPGDELDRVLFRSGTNVTLEPVGKTVPSLTGPNGERYTDHDPMLTEFRYTITGKDPAPETLREPEAPNMALQTLKEIALVPFRLLQVVFGLLELPYLIGQGIDMLIRGKMP
ncbi:MAG: endonuclease/exonuclease/phosphatase family protein [Clostridia bacterium]|nr:endonuclease/exonuclease/phosphatase family protein [Clostridia bacterium]